MASEIERLAYLEARLAIEDLNSNFCHYLDHGNVDALCALFTDSARYSHGTRVSVGRDEIQQLFEARDARGVRTARHMQTSLRIEFIDQNLAKGTSVCMTFAADAAPPIRSTTPFLVADFNDKYLRDEDGIWRICERHIERIFVDSNNNGPIGQ